MARARRLRPGRTVPPDGDEANYYFALRHRHRRTGPAPPTTRSSTSTVRADFPILAERVNGHPLIWLDNAATTQKPQAVIDRLSYFYAHENSNIHRAAHELAARATDAYEGARDTVRAVHRRRFAARRSSFVRGTTEAINLVAQELGQGKHLARGRRDRHLAPGAPRQHRAVAACCRRDRRGAARDPGGRRRASAAGRVRRSCSVRSTKLVAVTQVSNALGTVTPAEQIVELAHRVRRAGVDRRRAVGAAPARSTCRRWVRTSSSSPATRSSARPGSACCTAGPEVLEEMPAWQGGGNMIDDVTFEKTTLPGTAEQVRGRHRQHRRRRRAGRGAGLRRTGSASSNIAATSTSCWSTRRRGCGRSPGCA